MFACDKHRHDSHHVHACAAIVCGHPTHKQGQAFNTSATETNDNSENIETDENRRTDENSETDEANETSENSDGSGDIDP